MKKRKLWFLNSKQANEMPKRLYEGSSKSEAMKIAKVWMKENQPISEYDSLVLLPYTDVPTMPGGLGYDYSRKKQAARWVPSGKKWSKVPS